MKRGRNDADTCRLNGWTVGDRLIGEAAPYERVPTIRITGIGERHVLAIEDGSDRETTWALGFRNWWKVDES